MKSGGDHVRGDQVRVSIGDNANTVAAGKGIEQRVENSVPRSARRTIRVLVSFFLATILAIITNLVAADLEERFQLTAGGLRATVVWIVFGLTLVLSLWLALRETKR